MRGKLINLISIPHLPSGRLMRIGPRLIPEQKPRVFHWYKMYISMKNAAILDHMVRKSWLTCWYLEQRRSISHHSVGTVINSEDNVPLGLKVIQLTRGRGAGCGPQWIESEANPIQRACADLCLFWLKLHRKTLFTEVMPISEDLPSQ